MMPDADEYLRRAEEAEALGQAVRQARDRDQLLQLATEWRLLAAEASAPAASAPRKGAD